MSVETSPRRVHESHAYLSTMSEDIFESEESGKEFSITRLDNSHICFVTYMHEGTAEK